MDNYQLNIAGILRRGEQFSPRREIVTRLPDRSFHRYTYADMGRRARRLASALGSLGLERSDRVATLCWSHYQHLELYYAAPMAGFVTHPLNPRLHPDDIAYVARHAGDRVLVVDEALLPVYEKIRPSVEFAHVVVVGKAPAGAIAYEELLARGAEGWQPPDLDERLPALMGYSSGTTGRPKGVTFSHRAIAIHTLSISLNGWVALRESDVVLPVVPMYHALAWGWPYACALLGAKQVLPGPLLDPASLLEDFAQERVTVTGGVLTVWMGVLRALDADPGRFDLSAMRALISGGATAPRSMIEGYETRHGLNLVHTWGMTEMCMGMISEVPSDMGDAPEAEQMRLRVKQGRPMPFVEIRARGNAGLVPWDGRTMGELEVRGPWVADEYTGAREASAERWTEDGWFRTGDIVTIDERGFVEIHDRAKDVIKSGGEWISSVALESALMGHPAVLEAAVIAVPDEKWTERPLAAVVLREGGTTSADELRAYLAERVPKWWLPERFEFIDTIPKTAVGKFKKTELRERFAGRSGEH
ncbi:MAG TPA: long-chain fatty acid--CoA ligase [Burkholderiales bacterium]|nr:long-chain fatty acid--CoA ligase [Burkholderiales bacterium]